MKWQLRVRSDDGAELQTEYEASTEREAILTAKQDGLHVVSVQVVNPTATRKWAMWLVVFVLFFLATIFSIIGFSKRLYSDVDGRDYAAHAHEAQPAPPPPTRVDTGRIFHPYILGKFNSGHFRLIPLTDLPEPAKSIWTYNFTLAADGKEIGVLGMLFDQATNRTTKAQLILFDGQTLTGEPTATNIPSAVAIQSFASPPPCSEIEPNKVLQTMASAKFDEEVGILLQDDESVRCGIQWMSKVAGKRPAYFVTIDMK